MHMAAQREDRIEINDQSLLYYANGSGEVVDISMKGLSFLHLTGKNWPSGAFKIDLLLENSTLLIEQIPCSLNSTNKASAVEENGHVPQSLKFGHLNAEQHQQLQDFIARQKG